MSTYYIDGIPPTPTSPTSYRIWSQQQHVDIVVPLNGDPNFMNMNALDCCKDANTGKPVVSDKMDMLLPLLFTSAAGVSWMPNWATNLANNFKTYITDSSIQEEEIVFERNSIEVTKLDQCIFFNESGLGGSRVAFDKTTMCEIDTGAQHVDEGPGNGNPNYSFPKPGDTLIFSKSFFEILGFPNIISQWECKTTGNGTYMYKITLTVGTTTIEITDPNQLRVSNPDKNTRINTENCTPYPCEVLILLKELGDVMQAATYLVFIKLAENLKTHLATVQPTQEEVQLLLPINFDAHFHTCLQSKNINYSAIMLTCDKTVHYRNIKLGIPSCLTCSYKEDPYLHATHAGRIYLPITDPVEKLKSLLEMEYKIIEKNNYTIKQRLIMFSSGAKKLIYQKKGRGTNIVENNIPLTFNTIPIIEYIDKLTIDAENTKNAINAYITTNETNLRSNSSIYYSLRDQILGITEMPGGKFKHKLCPPFVIPVPPRMDQTSGIMRTNRDQFKLSLSIFTVPPGNSHQALYKLILDNLKVVGVLAQDGSEDANIVGGHSKQRGGTIPIKAISKRKPRTKGNISTSGFSSKKSEPISFSRSEKFLIYCLSVLQLHSEDTFILYTYCIYMLEYYKNEPIIITSSMSFGISDEEYTYYRLYRVLNNIVKSEEQLQIIKVLTQFGIYGLTEEIRKKLESFISGPVDHQVNDIMVVDLEDTIATTLEEFIDDYIDEDLLQYFSDYLNFTIERTNPTVGISPFSITVDLLPVSPPTAPPFPPLFPPLPYTATLRNGGRKHKSRKHKSRKHKSRKHKSRKHKLRKHKTQKRKKHKSRKYK